MNTSPIGKIPILGPCPVCGQGLLKVRMTAESRVVRGFIICDECEATWKDIALKDRFKQTSEHAVCPYTGKDVYDSSGRWADEVDLCLLGWANRIKHHDKKA